MTHRLLTENLSLSYGKTTVLDDISTPVPSGKVTSIVGANACGKSTFLRCLARLLKPTAGQVILDGTSIHKQNTRDVARKIALLPQSAAAPDGMRVLDLVKQGRTPHQSPLNQWSLADQEVVSSAIAKVGLSGFEERLLGDLSGGQRQRAWIAMSLAQDSDILLLDEPTTYLDLTHQIEILQLVRDLQEHRILTVVMVLHDINLATRFSDNLIALKDQRILLHGRPEDVISESAIAAIYGLQCSVIADPHTGLPHVIPR